MRGVITFVFCLLLLGVWGSDVVGYEIVRGEKIGNDRVITTGKVDRVNVTIEFLSDGRYSGYVTFYNEIGQTSVVKGGGTFYVFCGQGQNPNPIRRNKYAYYKELGVNRNNFKVLKVRGGRNVIGIPLKPFKLRKETDARYGDLSHGKLGMAPRFKYYWKPRGPSKKALWTHSFRPYKP